MRTSVFDNVDELPIYKRILDNQELRLDQVYLIRGNLQRSLRALRNLSRDPSEFFIQLYEFLSILLEVTGSIGLNRLYAIFADLKLRYLLVPLTEEDKHLVVEYSNVFRMMRVKGLAVLPFELPEEYKTVATKFSMALPVFAGAFVKGDFPIPDDGVYKNHSAWVDALKVTHAVVKKVNSQAAERFVKISSEVAKVFDEERTFNVARL